VKRKEAEKVKKLLLRIINSKTKIVESYVKRGLWVEGMLHMNNVVGNIYPRFRLSIGKRD